ncbi:SMI1/KNR4 family protein [Mucilaginibacter sp. KACC 22773]|uniref:SMI1/KNR4 family protein n=1 Tax=Mucilaginibacter sp. KACC 22773 TaxID=3025671 RepID=UPI002366101B|nr:SMI1/KNR4 family protein [Mucilaginibacter sp. KACC 22773]WDF76395.1 SMI1/KNR4 family protein [Mucilaginibacter sp. KACC 22773]
MVTVVQRCDGLITELSKFSNDMLYLGPPIDDDRLECFEKVIGFTLPSDFVYLLKKHNGFSLDGTEVCGLDIELRGASLDELYNFEHDEGGNKMPAEFMPFSPDGFGNHYCLDLSNLIDGFCPVVFWQHDCFYEIKTDVEVTHPDFINWVEEVMIAWTLENSNYDGTEK